MNYNPGLHILGEITSEESHLLTEYSAVKDFLNAKVLEYNLNSLGEVFHNFENGGYTGVVCLTESHIAIHTWPEFGIVTLDVYLSNFKKINDPTARNIFDDILKFFKAKKYSKKEIKR